MIESNLSVHTKARGYPIIDGYKVCYGCRENKPVSDFYTCKYTKGGYNYKCKTCVNSYNRNYHATVVMQKIADDADLAIKYLVRAARQRSLKMGIPCTITEQDIQPNYVCPILGIPISPRNTDREYSWSLDRVRPELGYVPGNVVIISNKANRMKQDTSLAQFETIIHYIKEHTIV